jgi:hypothetical protein
MEWQNVGHRVTASVHRPCLLFLEYENFEISCRCLSSRAAQLLFGYVDPSAFL